MAEYLIQGETLTATADKIRDCLGVGKYSFKSDLGSDGIFNTNAVIVAYTEFVDYNEDYDGLNSEIYDGDVFVAYDFLEDNNGVLTPVIYKTDIYGDEPENPDYADKFFYVGQAEVDGVIYDKWRKIEDGNSELEWQSTGQKYLYTNVMIETNELYPAEFPDKIQEVYDTALVNGGSTKVKHLGGTKWKWNDTLAAAMGNYTINFVSKSAYYSKLQVAAMMGVTLTYTQSVSTVAYNSANSQPWSDAGYQTISFVDGKDIANAALIDYLYANATLLGYDGSIETADATATALDIVKNKSAYVNGKKVTGALKFTKVTSLVNTTWRLSDNGMVPQAFNYAVNFVSNQQAFSNLKVDVTMGGVVIELKYGNTISATFSETKTNWLSPSFNTIKFISGTDITNPALIDWLYASAELQNGYEDGYDAGLALTDDATATADKIFAGETAWVHGYKITGTYDPDKIDDLYGTTWKLNETLYLPPSGTTFESCYFIAAGKQFSTMSIVQNVTAQNLKFDDQIVYNTYYGDKWSTYDRSAYRIISFSNSYDNIELINWLKNNAELISTSGLLYTPNSMRITGAYAYAEDCAQIVCAMFNNNFTQVAEHTFSNSLLLQTVYLPNTVTSIGESAFDGCKNLLGIVIPNATTTIGASAFNLCTSLETVTIGSSVKTIGDYAFNECRALKRLIFTGTKAQWNKITKGSYWLYNVIATSVECSDGNITF